MYGKIYPVVGAETAEACLNLFDAKSNPEFSILFSCIFKLTAWNLIWLVIIVDINKNEANGGQEHTISAKQSFTNPVSTFISTASN